MAFQVFSKIYLDILNGTIISTFLAFYVCPVICCLNLNEMILFLPQGKSMILLLLSKVGSPLWP